MMMNDLVDMALMTGRLEKEAEALSGDERFCFLDLVSKAGLRKGREEQLEMDRGKILCVPYSWEEGSIELCFLPREQFMARYRPTMPHDVDKLVASDTHDRKKRILRDLVVGELFRAHSYLDAGLTVYKDFEVLLAAEVPETTKLDGEDIAVAFLKLLSREPTEWVRHPEDPAAAALALELALRDAFPCFASGIELDEEALESVISSLPGIPCRPLILRCRNCETVDQTVRRIGKYCWDHDIRMATVATHELGHLTPSWQDDLLRKETVLVVGRTDLLRTENAEWFLHALAHYRTAVLFVTTDTEREVLESVWRRMPSPFLLMGAYEMDIERR